MDELVAWIGGLFGDCSVRAPFGIGWDLDRAEPPLTATVTPADCSTAHIVLRRDDVGERINFAARLQAFLDIQLDRSVPPCPNHQVGLVPARAAMWWSGAVPRVISDLVLAITRRRFGLPAPRRSRGTSLRCWPIASVEEG